MRQTRRRSRCASGTPTSSAGASASAAPSSAPSAAKRATKPSDTRLFPLELEREWTYEVESSYPKCKGKVVRVLSKRQSDGAFEVMLPCVTTFIRAKGNLVETQVRGGAIWERMLDDEVEAGHSWKTSNGSATYEYEYTLSLSLSSATEATRVRPRNRRLCECA